MKKRNVKKKRNWTNFILLGIAVLIIIILLFTYSGFTGKIINMASSDKYICSDSDDGKDYYVLGIVQQGSIVKGTDLCLSDIRLKEYYCLSETSTNHEYYDCPYKCLNGVCISESSTTESQTPATEQSSETLPPELNSFKRKISNFFKNLFGKD